MMKKPCRMSINFCQHWLQTFLSSRLIQTWNKNKLWSIEMRADKKKWQTSDTRDRVPQMSYRTYEKSVEIYDLWRKPVTIFIYKFCAISLTVRLPPREISWSKVFDIIKYLSVNNKRDVKSSRVCLILSRFAYKASRRLSRGRYHQLVRNTANDY